MISFSSLSQQMTIKGNVIDTNYQQPVRNAVAIAIRVKDSSLIGFQRTDPQGGFRFSMPVDTIELIIRHPEYGDYRSFFFGSTENNEFVIDPLPMPEKSTGLEEVVIFANKNPIYYRGDTLVYVADSFKVKENAVVEDLIRKLPGMKIDENGKITSQGKEIGQVLVDGDEFFGSDATIATKNLAAKGVETVQVYEKDSEDGSDEKIQVLDLKLKEEAKKGYFGKIDIAGGLNEFGPDGRQFFEGDVLFNKYSKNQKIAVYALGSNTPKANLDNSDMFKFGLAEGYDWMNESDDFEYNRGGDGINTSNGVPQTFKAGFYLDQKVWKGGKFRLNYSYADNLLKTEAESRSQYILTDTTYFTDVESDREDHYQQHQIGLKFVQELDSTSRIEVEPKLTINRTTQDLLSVTEFRAFNDSLTRYTTIDNSTEATGFTSNTTLRYYKDFRKKNRKMMARYNVISIDNGSDGFLYSTDVDAGTQTPNYTIDQKKENRNNSLAQTGFITYTEPIAKKWKTEFEYEFYNNSNDQRKTTFSPVNGEYVAIDSLFSNQFETDRQQHRVGGFLVFENAKTRISAGTRFRTIGIDNRNLFSDTLIRQDLNNVLPRVTITHRFTQSSRLRLTYNTNSALPSVDQLQPVVDNTNPNFIQVGNSALKPNFTHTVNANYNMWKGLSGFYVYAGMNYVHITDAFSTSTVYDNSGRTISQSINVAAADYTYLWAGTGVPIKKVKDLRLDVNLNGNFTATENYVNGERNETQNRGIGSDVSLNYNGDSLSLGVGGRLEYIAPYNSLSSMSNQPYTNSNLFVNVDWTLPRRWFIQTDATYYINTGRTANYNLNYVIWNASIQRSFLKTGNLYLGIEAYDILNQNISNYRTVTNNVIVDQKSTVIRRYFMLKMTLKFNNNHTKEVDNEMW
jgi:hypothetical protein